MMLLNEYKSKKTIKLSEKVLQDLQKRIEDIISQFDESSTFHETPNLIKLLIGKDFISAKSYLHKHLPKQLYNSTIDDFGEYTLGAIIIYVIGLLYNCLQESSVVRVSTLLDKLDTNVRARANIINNKMVSSTATSSKEGDIKQIKGIKYVIGTKLLEFMIEGKLIYIDNITADDKKDVVKEKGKGYLKSNLFAVCNFDLSLIPLNLNLPMVCKPLDWEHISKKHFLFDFQIRKPFVLSDMVGGYLSHPNLDIYNSFNLKSSLDNRFSLLSSRNLNNFNIELDDRMYKEMCNILIGLQKQGLKINKNILEFINNNRATLEK